ncbi:MAG: hypothetical protein AB7T38_12630 [Nitrospirales bacterium]
MPASDWLKADSTVKKLFPETAYAELTDRAKALTLSDLMRLNYYNRPGLPPANSDPQLKKITLEDMKSVARAFEVTLKEKGIDEGWKYTGEVFACVFCMCTCAATLPPGKERQETNRTGEIS